MNELVLLRRLLRGICVVGPPVPLANPTQAAVFSPVYLTEPAVVPSNVQIAEQHFQVLVSIAVEFQAFVVTLLATRRCCCTVDWSCLFKFSQEARDLCEITKC